MDRDLGAQDVELFDGTDQHFEEPEVSIPPTARPLNESQAEQALSHYCNFQDLIEQFPVIARHLAYSDHFFVFPLENNQFAFISELYDVQTGRLANRAKFNISQDAQGQLHVRSKLCEYQPIPRALSIRHQTHSALAYSTLH